MSNDTTDSNKYHGKPCKKCGEILRYKSSYQCVRCSLEKLCCLKKDNPKRVQEAILKYKRNNRDKINNQAREYYKNNKDTILKKNREYKKNNSAKIKAQGLKYEEENRDKIRAAQALYRKNNRKKIDIGIKRWRQQNPEKVSGYQRTLNSRRRALLNNAKSEPYNFAEICSFYNHTCLKCGKTGEKLTVDHIIPLSKGGDDIASNLQPLCLSCNASKGARHIDYRPDAGPLR